MKADTSIRSSEHSTLIVSITVLIAAAALIALIAL